MKYLLMMGGTQADAEWFSAWTQEQVQANASYIGALAHELEEAGVLLANECLAFPEEARLVRAGNTGEPVTDGVFPESKEFLAGYWLIEVDSAEDAYRIAARVSAAPGNKAHGDQAIEVRRVLNGAAQKTL